MTNNKTSEGVLISIRPNWCELIASGQKTIEVRKTVPAKEPPFRCFMYCTKTAPFLYGDEKVFVTDQLGIMNENARDAFIRTSGLSLWNGKVFGEFICERIIEVDCDSTAPFEYQTKEYIEDKICFGRKELIKYAGFKRPYGLCISKLNIYKEAKELKEFCCKGRPITRPPQSWCYVSPRNLT